MHRFYGWGIAFGLAGLLSVVMMAADSPAIAGDEVPELTRGLTPDWVEDVAWENVKESHPGHPAHVLLSDAQGSLRADGCDYYFRTVTRLLNAEGVRQNAEQTVTFSPEYERIVWHKLQITRGTEVIDLLPRVKFKRLQRELALESKIYDGRVTAVAVLEDVRIGDVLEVAYTELDTNPLTRGYPGFRMSLGSFYPQKLQSIIVRMPAELPPLRWYFFVPPDTLGLPEQIFRLASVRGALRDASTVKEQVHRWKMENVPGIPFDAAISGEAAPYYPFVRCTTFDWWDKVVKWARPLFETGEALPDEPRKLVAAWRRLPSERERLRAAVDWVQGDVRYFSMAFGQHNVKPRPMADVVASRFGDCKDKSVLLVALLRALDIPAWPALVNSFGENQVRRGGPDVHAFNHAIVAYEMEGQLRWVDPTLRQPAGPAGEWELPPGYSPALILREHEGALTELPKPRFDRPDGETVDRITFEADASTALIATEVRLRGVQADLYRMSLEGVTEDQRAKGWFNYLARFYPRLEEVAPPRVEDDGARNELVIRARYRWPNALRTEQGQRMGQFYAYALRSLLENPESRRRHWPLALPYGRSIRQRIEIELPHDQPMFIRPVVVRTKELEFQAERAQVGRHFTAVLDLRFPARYVSPDRMAVFANSVEEILTEMACVVRAELAPIAATAATGSEAK